MAAIPEEIRGEWIGTLRVRFVSGGSDVDLKHLDFDRVRAIAQEIATLSHDNEVLIRLYVEQGDG